MIKAIIIDDEDSVGEALVQLFSLKKIDIKVCQFCKSIDSAALAIRTHQPDILFLDVELGEENGFDIFKHFPSPSFKVIFLTGHQQYAVKAFRFATLDYILKPIDPDLLAESIKKAYQVIDKEKIALKIDSFLHNMSDFSKDSKKIILKTADAVHLIYLCDIMYCEADRSYTNFYLADKSRIMVSHNMGEYEELFSEHGFFRIHQSYLLNLNYFKRYEKSDGGKAILKDNTSLPVATRKKDQLLQLLVSL